MIRNLLVTGGAGFIGSNFLNLFCRENPGVQVTNVDALYYCGNEQNVDASIRSLPNYRFVQLNLQECC